MKNKIFLSIVFLALACENEEIFKIEDKVIDVTLKRVINKNNFFDPTYTDFHFISYYQLFPD